MKTSKHSFLLALMASVGLMAACSSDGTGTVPPGAYGTAGAPGQYGGAMGTVADPGGTVAVGGTSGAGVLSSADLGGGGSAIVQAGTTAATTNPPAGSTAITTIPSGGNSGTAGASKPATTAAGGTTGGGRTTTGGIAAAGGTTAAGGNPAAAGNTAAGGTIAAGGTTGAGGTTTRTGGTTAAGGAGGTTSTGVSNWWPAAFDANPSPNGKHNAGKACLNCHKTGGQGPAFLFGGTIYNQAGSSGVGHVQVGIKDGTKFISAYSGSNGNIWLPLGSSSVNWATAEIRIRNATGESPMIKPATNGDCNSCHDSTNRILTP